MDITEIKARLGAHSLKQMEQTKTGQQGTKQTGKSNELRNDVYTRMRAENGRCPTRDHHTPGEPVIRRPISSSSMAASYPPHQGLAPFHSDNT